jgi:hypothetical protein
MARRGLGSLAWAAAQDLFDQGTAFGRLALAHVAMMAGDTLVTVSLAGSLFFSVSPTEAKGRVLLYLLLTLAPFAVVSPVLGPLIDRSVSGRRWLVAASAGARVLLCWAMASHLTSLWLYPEAFAVLVASKLYGVTRATLVPEMARTDQLGVGAAGLGRAGWPSGADLERVGFAGFNAQLTLLGSLAGLVAGSVGAGLLKGLGAPSVLVAATVVFLGAVAAALRLPRPAVTATRPGVVMTPEERDRQALAPLGDAEVAWGLTVASLVRFAVGFATFLLAFGLRRVGAGLGWYAAALTVSLIGSLTGLGLVTRVRERVPEHHALAAAALLIGVGAALAGQWATTFAQVLLAGWLGLWAAVAQPSFDSITQRHVPPGAQGRIFARLAVRQQLLWVAGALIPVAVALSFATGDRLLAVLMIVAGAVYALGRRRPD